MVLNDLNVARALNRIAIGEDAKLGPSLNTRLQHIIPLFPKNGLVAREKVIFWLESMRVKADSFDKKLGRQRYTAVMEGMFYIHPCPLKIYLDALEVRYVDAMKSDVYVQQDIYLEYEKEEILDYPKHAIALGEHVRLSPSILTSVDPQMF